MTGLNHVLTGAAIGISVKQPLLIAPLAFLSHFILDSIPHFDHELYRYGSRAHTKLMLIDGLLCTSALLIIITAEPHLLVAILTGAFFAALPDVFWLYYYTHGRPQWWFFRLHARIQWFERPAGGLVEISYLLFISTVIIALQGRV